MIIVFRVDSSALIGTGHVMRCLTLAKSLRGEGCSCKFICREHEGNLINEIIADGFEVFRLPNGLYSEDGDETPLPKHHSWLGESWQNDAVQSAEAISSDPVDWLIVDHYALDCRWEQKLRPYTKRIMVIDDLADREHECDFLLDQNLIEKNKSSYLKLVPNDCLKLFGPKYGLLQPIYGELHSRIPPRCSPIKRILLYFGGGDHAKLITATLSAFQRLNRNDLSLDVVTNDNNSSFKRECEARVAGNPNICFHQNLPSLAPLMAKADLAIGAGGATSWERCCLGLPSLIITLAENQKDIAANLNQLGLAQWLGHLDEVNEEIILNALQQAIDHPNHQNCSRQCMAITDGLGAKRVSSVLMLNAASQVGARLAAFQDKEFVLDLFDHQNAFSNFPEDEKKSAEAISNFFYLQLRDPENFKIYLVSSEQGLPVGLIRFQYSSGKWQMDYQIRLISQDITLAKKVIEAALNEFRKQNSGILTFCSLEKVDFRHWGQKTEKNPACELSNSKLHISICTDFQSWINQSIPSLLFRLISSGHNCTWVHQAEELRAGDVCFILSYSKIVPSDILSRHKNNLVIHASDLPEGRGWSPATWMILEGEKTIPVTLLEAVPELDAGPIYNQAKVQLDEEDLIDDWRQKLADTSLRLIEDFVGNYPSSLDCKRDQKGEPSFYYRRKPEDSEIDVNLSLKDQFNLLRVVDNDEYPAFFRTANIEFTIRINKQLRSAKKH
jgi:UDP-2,4-diacetamido-2,4,6-trideoxy-beta-L-altropyranose hydrolase